MLQICYSEVRDFCSSPGLAMSKTNVSLLEVLPVCGSSEVCGELAVVMEVWQE